MSQISTSRRGRVRRRRLASVIGSPPVRRLSRRVRRRSSCSPRRARRLRRESRRGRRQLELGHHPPDPLQLVGLELLEALLAQALLLAGHRQRHLDLALLVLVGARLRGGPAHAAGPLVLLLSGDRARPRVGRPLAGLRAAQRRRVGVAALLVGLQRRVEDGREDAVEGRQLRLGGDEDRPRGPVEVAAPLRRDQGQRAREARRALGRDRHPRGAQPLAQRGRQAREVDPVQLHRASYWGGSALPCIAAQTRAGLSGMSTWATPWD